MLDDALNASGSSSGTFLVVNDLKKLNSLYRAPLIEALESSGYQIQSLGLFENKFAPILAYSALLIKWRTPFVSSNLRANLLCMTLIGKRGLIILNGLGRFRDKWIFRQFMVKLIQFNFGKIIAVQSYADFRYLRRFIRGAELRWVPGSGGTKRKFGNRHGPVAVQRDNKIELVAPSLIEFTVRGGQHDNKKLAIVGCADRDRIEGLFCSSKIENVGLVPQTDILLHGSIFLQPDGYGEGFPHSLADALVSEMPVWITNPQRVRYGLHKIGLQKYGSQSGWCKLEPPYQLNSKIGVDAITMRYVELASSLLVKA